MQIIEVGIVKPKTVKCSDCFATLAFLKKDIRQVYGRIGFNCPCCGKFIYMKENEDGELVRDY